MHSLTIVGFTHTVPMHVPPCRVCYQQAKCMCPPWFTSCCCYSPIIGTQPHCLTSVLLLTLATVCCIIVLSVVFNLLVGHECHHVCLAHSSHNSQHWLIDMVTTLLIQQVTKQVRTQSQCVCTVTEGQMMGYFEYNNVNVCIYYYKYIHKYMKHTICICVCVFTHI